MGWFKKRPVVIEAVKIPIIGELDEEAKRFLNVPQIRPLTGGAYRVETKEGPLIAYRGSWIIRGLAGEYYPCDDQVFLATYDQVEPPPAER